ncbi:GNAT family N-acetyltransferase [Streptomyces sp. NPDC059949]|uniref:GNAT family N-acetyltransferase n=1 Tax=Streptomyces sp. NPDC059949 TaxID=3347013 RepID=UPI0036469819
MHTLTSTDTGSTCTGIRIRPATPADGDTLVELISLVDLHLRAEDVPAALMPMRHALLDGSGPLSHGRNHFLIAENSDGDPVGAITSGPANWIFDPTRAPRVMRHKLVRRIATVHGLAVRPEYRHQGIARVLLRQAEENFRTAGYAVLALRHARDLGGFYQGLGYTSSNRLSLTLPTGELLSLTDRGWKHAFKILSPSASLTTIQGLPTITDALSG